VPQDHKESKAQLDLKAFRELLAHKAFKVLLVFKAVQDHKDLRVLLA
jgi:hypothetical protein